MNIIGIAGFATITQDPAASRALYKDTLALPLKVKDDYLHMDGFTGANHFGVWPLHRAAESCFGTANWPSDIPVPQATIEYELNDIASVHAAVREMQANGQHFVHEARTEPWGQTLARFISPEGLLIGLSYAPWLHQDNANST
jgi:catechol 2,3-dioxygenase-like lactoylglutathione lyase family enzyme